MKLQQLFAGQDIDWKRTKLIRHNLTNEIVAGNYAAGLLDVYQSVQTRTRFQGCDTIISFLGTERTNGVYQGCFRVVGSVPFDKSLLPENFVFDSGMDDNCAIYQLEPLDILSDLKDRLVIDWGRGTINWCQNGTTEKEILEIRPAQSEIRFKSYEDVILSFDTLHTIVFNQSAYKEWYDKLSAVAGVYLITDKRTGKHYVGSASGEQGGIWGRWSEYARTKHGGNKRLIELINADPEYCHNFQYSILEVFPIKKDRQEVLECERLYKNKLLSVQYGLNNNY